METEAQPTQAAEWLNSLLPTTHHLLLNGNSLFLLLVGQNVVSRRVGCAIRLYSVRRLYFYYITDFRKQWPYYDKSCAHRTLKLFSVWETWSYSGNRAPVGRAFYKVGKEKNLPSTPLTPTPDNQNLDSMAEGDIRYVWIVTQKIRQTVNWIMSALESDQDLLDPSEYCSGLNVKALKV